MEWRGCSIFLFFCRLAGIGFAEEEREFLSREKECVSYEFTSRDGDTAGCAGDPFAG